MCKSLKQKIANYLWKSEGSPPHIPIDCFESDAEELVDMAREHFAAKEVKDIDAEILIAEGIQKIPQNYTYEEFGTPVLKHLKEMGYRLVKS